MIIAALFIKVKNWKQSKCMDLYVHTMKTIFSNKNIMLSERQKQKTAYYKTKRHTYDSFYMNVQRPIYRKKST